MSSCPSHEELLVLIFMCATTFLIGACYSTPSPFLPRECELHGLGEATAGFLLGTLPLVECGLTFIWTRWVVKIGLWWMVNCGLLICGASTMLFATIHYIPSNTETIFVICAFAIRVLQSIGTSASLTSSMIISLEAFPNKSTLILSVLSSFLGLGMMAGPAIGGGFFQLDGFPMVFIGSGGIMVVTAIAMFIFLPKLDSSKREQSVQKTMVPYKDIVLNARMLIGTAVQFFCIAKWSSVDPILEPELRHNYGLPVIESAFSFLLISAVFSIATPIVGRFVGQPYCMDSLWIMAMGLSISAVAYTLAGPFPPLHLQKRLPMILISLSVTGVSNSFLTVPAQNVMFNMERLNLSDEANKTAARDFISSVYRCSISLGAFFGMTFAGIVGELAGWEWTMTVFAASCVLLLLVVISVKTRELVQERRSQQTSADSETAFLLKQEQLSDTVASIEKSKP